jgi:hypothetical protein
MRQIRADASHLVEELFWEEAGGLRDGKRDMRARCRVKSVEHRAVRLRTKPGAIEIPAQVGDHRKRVKRVPGGRQLVALIPEPSRTLRGMARAQTKNAGVSAGIS